MKTQKLMVLLASAALGLGLAGCAGNADASAPTYKVPTMAQMDKEKQVLNAERKDKAAKEYAAKAGSGTAARSGTSGRNYQPQARSNYRQGARHNYRQGKARGSYNYKARPRARRGGGGGDDGADFQRRLNAEMERSMRANQKAHPAEDTSKVIVCVGGNC